TIVTGAASGVTTAAASLAGTATSNNAATTTSFDYGTTVGYGSNQPATPTGADSGYSSYAISASISGLTANTLYHYRAVGTNSAGTTNGSDATFATLINAPTTTAATSVTASSFDANWTAGAGGAPTSYELDVATDAGFTSLVSGYNPLTGITGTSQSVTGLNGGTTYYYRVRAVGLANTSSNSNTTSLLTIPGAPTATAGTGVGATSFTANWTAPGGTVSDYRLDVSTDIGFGSFVTGYNDLTVAGTSQSVTGLTAATKYYYRARAVNASGTSANSNIDSATTISVSAPTVDSPTATSIGTTTATLGATVVNENNDPTTERGVVWSTSANPTTADTKIVEGNTGTGTYTVSATGLPNGTLVHYRGYAINGQGTGYTSDASFYTLKTEPTSHVGSFAANATGTATIDLSWTVATGADGYIVLQRTSSDPTGTPSDATGYSVSNTIGDGTVAAILTSGAATSTTISGLTGGTNYHYSIMPYSWDGANAATYNYYTAATIPTANATTFSSSSDVIATPGFIYKANINYALYTTNVNIDTSNSVAAFGVTVRDGGGSSDADASTTTLSAISFTATNTADLSRAALYDANYNELSEVAVSGSPITFSGLSLAAADGGSTNLVLRVSYKTTVTDNDQNAYTVSSVTAAASGSGFAAGDGGAATSSVSGDDNRIEVTATNAVFGAPIANTAPATNFTASVKAVDANGNTDKDFGFTFNITKDSGPGTLSGSTAPSPVNGAATVSDLQVSSGGTYVLRVAANAVTFGLSNSFVAIAPAVFKVAGPAMSPDAPMSPLTVDTLYWDNPATWTIVSGGSATGIPHRFDQVILDHSFHANAYVVVTDTGGAPALWDSCAQLTVGAVGNSVPVGLLIPKNGPTSGSGGPSNLWFGDGVAGNYDMVIAGGGTVTDAKINFARSVAFNSISDSMWIRTGGKWLHVTKGFNTMHRILSRRFDGDYGTVEIDVDGTVSGTFDISGGGNYYYPNLTLSNTSSAPTYYWFGVGQTTIKGTFTVNAGAKDSMVGTGAGPLGPGSPFVHYGDIVNNGIMTSPSGGAFSSVLLMRGSSAQTISGSGSFDLGAGIVVMNPAGVNLSSNVNVSGGLVQTDGNYTWDSTGTAVNVTNPAVGVLNTGSSTISINPSGAMQEGPNPVQGNVSATRTANQNANQTFGSIGYEINAAGGAPGSTTILRKTGVASTGNGNQSIKRYYDVTPTNNTALNATTAFYYVDGAELNGITETDLLLQKSTDAGATWSGKAGTINTSLNKITATGVNSFSRWTAASQNAPLFITHTITVRKFQDLDGDINTTGDQTAKKWRLSLYRDSVSAGTLINTGNLNGGVLASPNLEAGTYIAVEADSAGWLHNGKKRNGTPFVGNYNADTVAVSGGVNATIDFFNQKVSSVSILKFKDTDGDANTIESAKTWHLALYKTSVSGGNLVAEADTSNLYVTGLLAGLYIAVESDSGPSWVRLNGNTTRFDTLTVLADQTVIDTFINFQPNSITVRKYEDNDGNFSTSGDRVLKSWYVEVVGKGNSSSGTVVVNNLGDGSYTAQEADSATWTHLGYLVNGVPTASGSNNVLVNVAGGQNIIVDFVNAPPIYSQLFRSFRPDSIALDKDNKGKTGKYVKRKAVRSDFQFTIVASDSVNDLHVEFDQAIDQAFPFTISPNATASNPDGKGKKWDYTFASPLHSGDSVTIAGFGNKGKAIKVGKYYWTLNGTIVGLKLKNPTFTRNIAKFPMPNRVNALFETFEQGGFTTTSGLLVGQNRSDLPKQYGWLLSPKYTDVLKTLSDKTGLQTGDPGGFDVFTNNGKPLIKLQKSLPPTKHNNKLMANMVALKVNIAASTLQKTPAGFGELIYDDGSNSLDGMMVKDIGTLCDSLMMGYYDSTATHKFADTSVYNNLNYVIDRINSAFEGAVDTLDFEVKLHMKGTKSLLDVPYLRANPNIAPVIIAGSRNPVAQVPDSYTLYQNYPNPFNPTTTISFDLPEAAFVTLKVYNVLGQEVATLFDRQQMDDGTQEVQFNAGGLASGVYFYRIVAQGMDDDGNISTSNFTSVMKMLLVK
ncbi:MAG TPA: fibronectin type III domain-containing protein, partial [Bacteroidota bacterium]|nr:fibronectin type III domain-containing protein [Bacteroidota bacterium]